jgi:hypothetical protein
LAFARLCTRLHRRLPEADVQENFRVSPLVHQMTLTLARAGLIRTRPRATAASNCSLILRDFPNYFGLNSTRQNHCAAAVDGQP